MSARYRVTHGAVTVQTAVTEEGARAWVDVAPGKLLPGDVPASEVEMLLRQGRIEAVEDEPQPEPSSGRPSRSAVKDEWVAYARSVAKDSDEEAAIDGLTKDQLIELYGGES
ncbi:hypothetical protein PV518_25020 [Streptomyces sp. ND04-05B]|uniref:hypothetical protein n=1 Tax=Streptomyces sp. ND04-05B TaxID=3028693 RepID=UPI0029AB6237|nr:hypothetical protein [Streptomyces sp. ND04-05B]MDX3065399.1 hypothetical protein [Streptomyces sp. ND04-05B]